jgi:hypothetical protein
MKMMMGAAALCVAAVSAEAETIEFEADQGVVFARCAPHFVSEEMTVCEAIFPLGTQPKSYECVAIDTQGKAVGASLGPDSFFDGVAFNLLDPAIIADMKCRKR